MSIAASALSAAPLGGDPAAAAPIKRPGKRRITAKRDIVQQPEPR
jgi:hypothetical protein